MRAKISIILVIMAALALPLAAFDLVYGDCDSLQNLPLTEEQKEAICREMTYGGGFGSIYELLDLGVFTPAQFEEAKTLFTVGSKTARPDPLARIDSLYFRIGQWLTGESVSSEIVDEWLDAIRNRPVISELGYRDLVSLPNVSSTDAVALLNHRDQVGLIKDRRQLRSVDGLSAYGYVSVRSYIGYGEPRPINWLTGGYAQGRFGGYAGETDPYSTLKLRLDNGPLSEGIRFGRDSGEQIDHDNWANPFDYPDTKFYMALSRHSFGPVRVRHLVLGDYSASFGEGVTFSTGDYFSPRRSGVGFDVRRMGIAPDLSNSQTYAMRGAALEFNWKSLEPTLLFSSREKDAITYNDSSFSELISGAPGWEDRVRENVMGGDLTFAPRNNLRLGVTGYYAGYDRSWDPEPGTIIDPEHLPGGGNPKVTELDAELFSMTGRQDYRSALGAHGLWTIGDLALSAEYAEVVRDSNITVYWNDDGSRQRVIGKSTSFLPIGDDPYGLVAKAHLKTNRLTALALYRHYDLGFDNPYNRGFSEYARYKGSLVEDDYRLVDPSMFYLAEENPRPMAEDGLYLELYGRPFRQLSTTLEFDAFTRLSDMADYRRIVLKANWRPSWNLTFRLWRKWQGRSAGNSLTPKSFEVDEIRLTGEARLSGYSRLAFTVIHSYLSSPPRPQYVEAADPLDSDPYLGSVVDPSDGLMLTADVNAGDHLSVSSQAIVYRGWLWNFENNEFAELESATDALRWWVAVKDRLVENLSVTAKLTIDTPLQSDNLDVRSYFGGDEDSGVEGERLMETSSSWSLQLDYFF